MAAFFYWVNVGWWYEWYVACAQVSAQAVHDYTQTPMGRWLHAE